MKTIGMLLTMNFVRISRIAVQRKTYFRSLMILIGFSFFRLSQIFVAKYGEVKNAIQSKVGAWIGEWFIAFSIRVPAR